MARKNWDRLRRQSITDTLKYRDVYESQQLERSKSGQKKTFTSRNIVAICVGILAALFVWSLWSFFDVSQLDDKSAEDADMAVVVTQPASSEPRVLADVKWANMLLIPDSTYSQFGYDYMDKKTGIKYTKAEYDIWLSVHERINNGECPELLVTNNSDGTRTYKERDPVSLPPDEPRNWSHAECLNFTSYGVVEDATYADLGYTHKETYSGTWLTPEEYEALEPYYDEQYVMSLLDSGVVTREVKSITYNGKSKKVYYYTNADAKVVEPIVPTENAGTRYTTPIELSELEYANMLLVEDKTAASLGYSYRDKRTGLFYTLVEYEKWKTISQDALYGRNGLLFWIDISMDDWNYVYSLVPPENAGDEVRERFTKYLDPYLMKMNMSRLDQFWGEYGYPYYDNYTKTFYSEAEYQIWLDVQTRVANGTLFIPQKTQSEIRSNNINVTATIREHLDPLPVEHTYADGFRHIGMLKIVGSLAGGLIVYAILRAVLKKNLEAQNLMNDTSDINQYENDQHIALPEEVQRKFDWFPDAGAHCPVQVSSMISHVMLTNKGINKVKFCKRTDKDIVDEDGDIIVYKGEPVRDQDGELVTELVPLFDTDFGADLFETSGVPKEIRKFYDTNKIPYNPDGKDRTKQSGTYKTVANAINNTWTLPDYEPQRPAGAYLVDTEPVNTMILAITRAGKGQSVIEPTIDMWTRETRPNNMVINDPKGELLVKNYVKGTVRGFQIVQFNLINAMKTDIYNPLGMAADSAREGDFTKCAMYIDNIASVFFPVDGADDPVWPNAANNAFKRAAYGLIDYYLEEEKELRREAERINLDPKILETKIDQMWGKVTLYNCYQLFVQLTSKKMQNPLTEFNKNVQLASQYAAENEGKSSSELPPVPNEEVKRLLYMSPEEFDAALEEVETKADLWEGAAETDLLSLFFSATDALPRNSMRNLVSNANNSLRAMGGAEKMLASVYGIAITAMSFFTDPTIATLTSGLPSQNVDLAGMSFPRRLGVRLHADYIKTYHLAGLQVKWNAYSDELFEKQLGKEFEHEDLITREGWARYYFKGVFPNDIAYLRMQIKEPSTDMLVKEFFFKFEKNYQTTLDGKFFVKDPVLGTKIVKNGVLTELKAVKRKKTGETMYIPRKTTFKRDVVDFSQAVCERKRRNAKAIIRTMCRYSEQPKMVFLVTPPHLMNYAKLILILIKQLVDLNFDQSYMTKSDQKPLYKTRFMLDELGNLQSDGHGISGFETMLSIGLGQDQQFTLILQTLQQLKDVYGDSVDKIVQGNAQPLSSKIATPDGWKLMGDLAVGDEVLTPFGDVTTVTGVYPKGVRPVYRVTLRDGSSAEVCNQHLWQIERYKTSLVCTYQSGKQTYVRPESGKTCELITEVINTDELKRRVDKGRQINIPKVQPVAYPTKDLPIHPYVLGLLLGDGRIDDNGYSTITVADKDNEILSYIKGYGYRINRSNKRSKEKTPVYYVSDVWNAVKQLGLNGRRSWEKFIPVMYLQADVEQRILLLQGLMDSDGTISSKGEMEFTSSSSRLAYDVQELIWSLGGRVSVNVKNNVTYTSPTQHVKKTARPAYRVQNIRLSGINPFRLERKRDRWHDRADNSGNRVVSVEYIRDDEVQCIRVADGRHLYLTDNYIPTHNTSNIVFLKSTDDSMIETLSKMSGVTHKSFTDSKTITRDIQKIMMQNEGKTSYTMTTREMPVISFNDMAYISERNSIVFRAGDSPVWNRNETVLPMSWRLFKNTIKQPGKDYSLQTIPTLSSALNFDIRQNQPDFVKMLDKRMAQACKAKKAKEMFQTGYNYTEAELAKLDIDAQSDEIMSLIQSIINNNFSQGSDEGLDDEEYVDIDEWSDDMLDYSYDVNETENYGMFDQSDIVTNDDAIRETAKYQAAQAKMDQKLYANRSISRSMLIRKDGSVKTHAFDKDFSEIFANHMGEIFNDTVYFKEIDGNLCGKDGTIYITKADNSAMIAKMNAAAKNDETKIYAEDEINSDRLNEFATYTITDAFYQFLANLDSWNFANGVFETEMARRMNE